MQNFSLAAKKNEELKKAIKAATTKELIAECAHAAMPDRAEAVVALVADVALAAIVGDGVVKAVELAVGAAATYGAVRSGVMARNEWTELAQRGLATFSHQVNRVVGRTKVELVEEETGVTPLSSTPELVAQAMFLQGRRI